MKLTSSLTAWMLALGVSAAVSAQEVNVNVPGQTQAPAAAPAAEATPATPAAPAAPTFTENQLVEEFGWFMAKRIGLSELDFTPEQTQQLVKGVVAAAENKESPYDLTQIGPHMDEFMKRKQSVYMDKMKQKSQAESSTFFAGLKKKAGVVALPDGLYYEIITPGEGPAPKPDETVKVKYTGTLVDGTVFDSTEQHGGTPAEFVLNQVIPGWTEGLQKISKGGKIKLYVPANLAYGDEGRPGIPPSSTLIFDIELLDIQPTAAAPAAATPAVGEPAPEATAPAAPPADEAK
jgi:FKBP-type peptidyl-prolyl cis-trans isomerase